MTVITHCLPNGSWATNEIPVCNISDANVGTLVPSGGVGHGNIRGVVVSMHGLSVVTQSVPPNIALGNVTIAGYATAGANFESNLLADGWICVSVPYPEDYYALGSGALGIWRDINSDSGNGSRYLRNQMHWWDHVVLYIQNKYGKNIPIVPFGGSWGGYHTLQVAINRQSSIVAYCSDVPATILANASYAYTSPVNYGPNLVVSGNTLTTPLTGGTSGLDIPTNALNPNVTSSIGVTNTSGVTVPGIILYGMSDGAIGWQTTSSLPGVGPIDSNIDSILTNANSAGLPVIRNQTTNIHEFTNDDAGYSATYINTGPTTLSSINSSGRLDIKNTSGGSFGPSIMSGRCGILASDNSWHTLTFTNFGFTNYTTTAVSDVTTLSGATITLGDTTGLNRSSGYINILTSGTTLLASFSSIVGNTLHGVTYVSGSGSIAPTGSGFTGNSVVTLVNYCSTSVSDVTTLSNATLTLNSTVGLSTTGGTVAINTDKLYLTAPITVVLSYTGVSGSTITGVNYVSGGVFFGNGKIVGDATSAVTLITPLTGVTVANPGSATISSGSPVCSYGIPIPGGFHAMSMIYWFTQYVDPIAPKQY
jgi:hypothetical protein